MNNQNLIPGGKKRVPLKKVSKSFMDFCKGHSVQSINACYDMASNPENEVRDRIAGYKIVIEYAEGKPRQPIDGNITTMTFAEALALGIKRREDMLKDSK